MLISNCRHSEPSIEGKSFDNNHDQSPDEIIYDALNTLNRLNGARDMANFSSCTSFNTIFEHKQDYLKKTITQIQQIQTSMALLSRQGNLAIGMMEKAQKELNLASALYKVCELDLKNLISLKIMMEETGSKSATENDDDDDDDDYESLTFNSICEVFQSYVPLALIGHVSLYDQNRPEEEIMSTLSNLTSLSTKCNGKVTVSSKFILGGKDIDMDLQKANKDCLVHRDIAIKFALRQWVKLSAIYEAHLSSSTGDREDEYGAYQGMTDGCVVKLWQWLLSERWVVDAVASSQGLTVVDAGSGLNNPCVIGSYISGCIKMAIGLEADRHKAQLAASSLQSLCLSGHVCPANVGMYFQDFTDPGLNLKGIDLIIFWDRAFNTESCIQFYDVLYNSIGDDNEVLLLHSKSRLSERLKLMEELFVVHQGKKFTISMKGSSSSDTLQLLKLRKNPEASISDVMPHTLNQPLIDRALEDFTEGHRVASYLDIIHKTALPRLRVNPKKRFREEDIY